MVEIAEQFLISPGEIRALAWVQERNSDEILSLDHVRDAADVGWIVARVRKATGGHIVRDYWLSPTGRVFRGEKSQLNSHFSHRTDEELRAADYADARTKS